MTLFERAFRNLSRTQKSEFISKNIEYAYSCAVAEYAKNYILDILDNFDKHELQMVSDYVCSKGYALRLNDTAVQMPKTDKINSYGIQQEDTSSGL